MLVATKPTALGRRLLDALAGPHGLDRYVELVRPTFSTTEVRAEVVAVERQTPDSVTLTLEPNANWRGFRAGQFVSVAVEIDGVRRTRCYSPAGSQHGDGLELTVKAHPRGLVSGHLHRAARPGLVLGLSQADGDFVLPDERPDDLLLISGGSGITPVMSMLRTLRDEAHDGRVRFLHFSRGPACYAAELGGCEVVDTASAGRLGAERLDELASSGAETYVCGPTSLVDAIRETWVDHGLADRLHVEYFVPPAPAPVDGDEAGTVAFARSGVEAPGDGRPLLVQAEAAGLRPEYGCRMGICHTCACRLTSGHVRDLQTGALTAAADQEIRVCVSAPVGGVTIDL